MVSISLINVKKSFGKTRVLNNINLEIKNKEFMVLVGPSGCGKSTTLNIIAGLEFVTTGTILFDNEEITQLNPRDRKVSMVFQSYALYPHMDVYENMSFGLKIKRVDKDEITKKVNKAARILGLEDLLRRKPKNLSGGQRQRVALGRAIVREPTVFLLDEPLSNLDAKLRVEMRKQIKKLHRQIKTTFVYVTHDQVEAMSMADRICIMDNGNIKQVGTPDEVYDLPANKFVAGFIGSPAMNFVDCEVTFSEGDKLCLSIGNEQYQLPNNIRNKIEIHEMVTLGIRPEHITISPEPFENCYTVKNDIVEFLGASTLINVIFVNNPNLSLNVISDGKYSGEVDGISYIGWNFDKINLFDIETEINIISEN